METIICPECHAVLEAVRIGARLNCAVAGEYDHGYCPACSRTFARNAATGETFATTIRPLCHICCQELTLDIPRSTTDVHVYHCREHDRERCSYVADAGAWIWHSTARSTPVTH